ncbi:ArsR family transcriptional regulator [Actibacterium mucosum KCTC 23349]|uniref:ArsR family transcriptional regulator n=1 Tax=Actibacterium mucosum KCTC 23349 TaxID=1454373 RepID=A0A037ZP38_9RHOB|nr:metalloregulator ArsR/SmtB family transcription factor [Actibacterium mucosum]KAJ57400.1 ArsR family transcriptional regulator [Actibacterium mucosum KCTC 23349]
MTNLPRTFAALADETRFAIVERLLQQGAQSAGDLADIAPISPPAFSRHLKVLREAGLVTQTIDKQRRIYAVQPETMQAISDWIISRRAFWEGSMDRLEKALLNRGDA